MAYSVPLHAEQRYMLVHVELAGASRAQAATLGLSYGLNSRPFTGTLTAILLAACMRPMLMSHGI
jgi:hypothetical protein